MTPNIGILTFEQMNSKLDIGSTRIRALWVTKYWPEAELFMIGRRYSAVIFQKAYWLDYAREFSGVKVVDVCDPDFLHWKSDCIHMANVCDIVTTSTQTLADEISRYTRTPTVCVPDRLDLQCFSSPVRGHLNNGNAQTAAWFGYSRNFGAVDASIPDLLDYGIRRLIVVSEEARTYELPAKALGRIELVRRVWNFETLTKDIAEADIVINYQLKSGRWKYKSNNKTLFAWAMGFPVAHSGTELRRLIPESVRAREAVERLAYVRREYDIRQSVMQYKNIIDQLAHKGSLDNNWAIESSDHTTTHREVNGD